MSSNLTPCTFKVKMMKINVERKDIKDWIEFAKNEKGDHEQMWGKVAKILSVSKRKRITVNLYKLNKFTKEGDNVIVPGKVLSIGRIDHKINITAIDFSDKAKSELIKGGSKIYELEEFKKLKGANIIS